MSAARLLSSIAASLLLMAAARAAYGHGDVMRIGSSQSGSGQLLIESEFDFDLNVHLGPSATVGDQTLYSAIIPSFAWILEPMSSDHFPVGANVTVSVALTSPISPGASMRVGGRLLDAPGESATLGTFSSDPEEHIHPEWQLILANGVVGEYSIAFRLSTNATGYTTSPVYQLTLTNAEAEPTPTASTTPTPTPTLPDAPTDTPTEQTTPTPSATQGAEHTATPTASPTETATGTETETETVTVTVTATETATPSPTVPVTTTCVGDCDATGTVTVNELVRAVGLAIAGGSLDDCPAADRDASGTITVDELVAAVRSALSGCASD